MSEYIDAEGITHETYDAYLEYLVGLCGCRNDVITSDLVAILDTYLKDVNDKFTYYNDLPVQGPEKYRELLLHVLDHAGLLEHGTSIRGSWLTDKGKVVARKLREERVPS